MPPAGLVDGLARARIGGTCNQYAGSELRRERLRAWLVRDRRVIAVGRVAASALEHAPAIRHPSHGGARPFADGLRRTLGL